MAHGILGMGATCENFQDRSKKKIGATVKFTELSSVRSQTGKKLLSFLWEVKNIFRW